MNKIIIPTEELLWLKIKDIFMVSWSKRKVKTKTLWSKFKVVFASSGCS